MTEPAPVKERHVATCDANGVQLRLVIELGSSGWTIFVENANGMVTCEIALSLAMAKPRAERIAIDYFGSRGVKTPPVRWDQVY